MLGPTLQETDRTAQAVGGLPGMPLISWRGSTNWLDGPGGEMTVLGRGVSASIHNGLLSWLPPRDNSVADSSPTP